MKFIFACVAGVNFAFLVLVLTEDPSAALLTLSAVIITLATIDLFMESHA